MDCFINPTNFSTQCLTIIDENCINSNICITIVCVCTLVSILIIHKFCRKLYTAYTTEKLNNIDKIKQISLHYKSTRKGAQLFQKFDTDAGFDFVQPNNFSLPPRSSAFLNTRICIQIPEFHVGILHLRSSSFRSLKIQNGIIDHNYTGNIYVHLTNKAKTPLTLYKNNRYFQIVILPIPNLKLRKVPELPHKKEGRNSDKFGSSGAKTYLRSTHTHHTPDLLCTN